MRARPSWDGGASDPFMMSHLPLSPAMNQRFPGQYYDGETGLHYNYFRDYDPSLGRYAESDPIGLRGGVNTFAYVGHRPTLLTDPLGLFANLGPLPGVFPNPGALPLPSPSTDVCNAMDSGIRPTPIQTVPPDFLFEEPPVVVRPPLPDFPQDLTRPPGPGWEWRGQPGSKPGGQDGNWYNPGTDESLHNDMSHPPGVDPHLDYKAPNGNWYRWFPDGTIAPKA